MKQSAPPVVKSAIRAIDVLEFVAASDSPPTFAEIGASLEIPNSSLFYLLNTLSQRGYLQQDGGRGYRLGTAVSGLAQAVSAPASWVARVTPLVEQVWGKVQETTSYLERRGDEIECLISRLAPHSLLPVHRVGQRAPLYVFSGGKIILSQLDDKELEQYIRRTPLKRLTPHTLTSSAAIRREIVQVRSNGFALSREEHSLGIVGISVGLKTPSGLIGTLGVAIPAVRFSDTALSKIRNELQGVAKRFLSTYAGA
jgi:IclR family transcriptional regulator, acetate operon repressor